MSKLVPPSAALCASSVAVLAVDAVAAEVSPELCGCSVVLDRTVRSLGYRYTDFDDLDFTIGFARFSGDLTTGAVPLDFARSF